MSHLWQSIDPRTSVAVAYNSVDNAALEQSYQQNPRGNHVLVLGGSVFTVDFAQMLQFNATGGSRQVVRTQQSSSTSLSAQQQLSPSTTGVLWQSIDPRTSVAVAYSSVDNAALEQSYQQNPQGNHVLVLGGSVFTVDFAQMRQFNATGGSRQVVRNAASNGGSSFGKLMQQISSRLGALSQLPSVRRDEAPAPVEVELSRILKQITEDKVVKVVEAIKRSEQLCESVVSNLAKIPHDFAPNKDGPSLAALAVKNSVDPQPVCNMITIILDLMTVGSLSCSDMDFSSDGGSSKVQVEDLLSIAPNQRVPQYYANFGGESIFRRKYLSVLGLRNLSTHGFDIFCELFATLFSSNPGSYPSGRGLNKMRDLTGNTVDLDTVVLNCRTQLIMANKLLQDEATDSGRKFTPFGDPSAFFASDQAKAMATRQAEATLSAFVDLMQLNSFAAAQRQVVLPAKAEHSIPTAFNNTQRGLWPLWGYSNGGVNTYHANAPHVPDVVGALLRAPFHLAKGFLMCLHASGVMKTDWFNGDKCPDEDENDTCRQEKRQPLLDLSDSKLREAAKLITVFFDKAVSDSCFNAKWKAIESYIDDMTTMDDVPTVIGRLQEQHQSVFSAELFESDDPNRTKEQAALLAIIASEGTKARDPQTRSIRLLCKADVEKWIADTM